MQMTEFGPVVLFPSNEKDRPFQAEFEQLTVMKLPGAASQRFRVRGTVYRDSNNRRRQDMQLDIGPGQTLDLAYIHDPVGHVVYVLDVANRVATSERLKNGARPGNDLFGSRSESPHDRKSKGEPARQIEGLLCRRYKTIQTDGATVESWFSDELMEVVVEKLVSNTRERTTRLFNIQRVEPDSSLFSLSSDYKVVRGDIER